MRLITIGNIMHSIMIKKYIRKARLLWHTSFDNYIFIHINKTGGTSVTRALSIPFEHKTAMEKIDKIGLRKWEKKFSFTIVRNPWDKVVSHYHYRLQRNQANLQGDKIEFKDWVRLAYGSQDPFFYNYPKMFMPQYDWIADHSGKILVDFICRFENLNNDFQTVCDKIGEKASLPHIKPSLRGDYREYYDNETIRIIEKWFEKDIRAFGYSYKIH